MIRIGTIGIGFMGMTHFEACTRLKQDSSTGKRVISGSKLKGAKIAAIAEQIPERLAGDWTSIQGNFGPRGTHMDLSKIRTYSDHRELLADPDIDLVDICLPTNHHEKVVLEAIAAGKNVFVEKPISTSLPAANRMVRAAEKAGVLLMVGHVLPFFPEFRFVVECLQSGKYGPLLAAHFRRVITPPTWSTAMADFRKLGGWGIDLHIHDNHLIRLLCGLPKRVFSRGLLEDGYVNHVHTQYVFDDSGPTVSCVSGGIAAPGLVFAHGFELYFEKATLLFSAGSFGADWVVERPVTLITSDGKIRTPKLKGGTEWCSAFTTELQSAVEGVKRGVEPEGLSGRFARDALKICCAEAKSIATGKAQRLA